MTLERFKFYMDEIRQEYDMRETYFNLGINIVDKFNSFYYTIDLLSELMGDGEAGIIPYFIFEAQFGQTPVETDDGRTITNVDQLYDYLTRKDGAHNGNA